MVLIGEQLEQHDSIVGLKVTTSSLWFTLYLKDWNDEWNKIFKDDVLDFLEIDSKTEFKLFVKDKPDQKL